MGVDDQLTGGRGPSGVPAGRPRISAKVYRRRRQVVGGLLVLMLAGLIAGGIFIGSLLGGGPASTVIADPAASNAAKPAPKPVTPPAAVCDEAGIKVSAAVDKAAYGPQELPVLTLRVTNSGQAPCDINVGTSQMEYQITSGNDVIFNSKHCQLGVTDLVKNLAPGASETANFVWKVNRSAPDCAEVAAEPGRSGGSYSFVATLGKWSSSPVIFTLK